MDIEKNFIADLESSEFQINFQYNKPKYELVIYDLNIYARRYGIWGQIFRMPNFLNLCVKECDLDNIASPLQYDLNHNKSPILAKLHSKQPNTKDKFKMIVEDFGLDNHGDYSITKGFGIDVAYSVYEYSLDEPIHIHMINANKLSLYLTSEEYDKNKQNIQLSCDIPLKIEDIWGKKQVNNEDLLNLFDEIDTHGYQWANSSDIKKMFSDDNKENIEAYNFTGTIRGSYQ